ncbi:protein mono-ADP-ribosyltransferase PARP11-like isoform X2 [Clarias gariepinus]|uniref:protein mono-ADP-ribosyltransferase PARP11-like isoform X2 n=1 Tax=Clarias gariepinus TaxID=13013 RepID=UPI00234D34C5|nr:protein mono-ADP-ribosyltransferase PARP11-like isoform X2 [Clarias gariepinus]
MFVDFGTQDDGTEPMDTSDYPCYWFYEAVSGVWHRTEDDPVNLISSSDLEILFAKNPNGVITITTAAGIFKIDFCGFLKTNLRTGQAQKLKRSLFTQIRCTCANQAPSVPAHWEKMDAKAPYKAFTVDRRTSEFEKVERYVREIGLLQEPLKYIHRIQNVDLWELYCRKKTQLMRIKGQSDIEERMLFHGTGKNNLDSICLYNFDCRISESVRYGHLYGKGTYFSIHASYADMYSKSRSQGHTNETRIMLLARVIVGKYTTGQKNLCKPDGDQIENIHDSCVDNTLCPRTFVIFNSNQIYPEYVLEYGG